MKRAKDFKSDQEFVHYLIKREQLIGACIGISAGLLLTLVIILGSYGIP